MMKKKNVYLGSMKNRIFDYIFFLPTEVIYAQSAINVYVRDDRKGSEEKFCQGRLYE